MEEEALGDSQMGELCRTEHFEMTDRRRRRRRRRRRPKVVPRAAADFVRQLKNLLHENSNFCPTNFMQIFMQYLKKFD